MTNYIKVKDNTLPLRINKAMDKIGDMLPGFYTRSGEVIIPKGAVSRVFRDNLVDVTHGETEFVRGCQASGWDVEERRVGSFLFKQCFVLTGKEN